MFRQQVLRWWSQTAKSFIVNDIIYPHLTSEIVSTQNLSNISFKCENTKGLFSFTVKVLKC